MVEAEGRFPTFTTARPSPTPGRKPAGLALCPDDAIERWKKDLHRFPPYQYRRENCVVNSQSQLRVPSAVEREEVILGLSSGYTSKCLAKANYGTQNYLDCRLKFLGNSWSVPVVACLLHSLFFTLGLVDELTTDDIVTGLTPGKCDDLPGLLLRPPVRQTTKAGAPAQGLVHKLL